MQERDNPSQNPKEIPNRPSPDKNYPEQDPGVDNPINPKEDFPNKPVQPE